MPEALDVVIVGGGPCGLAAGIAMQQAGLDAVIIERSCVVSSIAGYPTYMTFFSSPDKLSIGGLPFVIAGEKPTRRDALAYYRATVTHFGLAIRQYERVEQIERAPDGWVVHSLTHAGEPRRTHAGAVVIATGYFGSPNRIGAPGEDLPHVTHHFREGHEAFQQDVVVVGGGNSAAEAALDLYRVGARVTLVHAFENLDKGIKPWVIPDLQNRIKEGAIQGRWNSRVAGITPHEVVLETPTGEERLPAEHVYLMTGYTPNSELLQQLGVPIDADSGVPAHDPETMETPVPGIFIAGVLASGFDANKIFIENGRDHGSRIAAALTGQRPRRPAHR